MRRRASKWNLLNRRYPWLKIVVFMILIFTGCIISVGSLGKTRTETLAAGGLGNYEELVVLEGEVREVTGLEEASEKAEVLETKEERREKLEGKKLVALTFDDGPQEGVTERILATLKEKGARATFFMLGIQVEKYPELARQVAKEGNEVENHSTGHRVMSQLSLEEAVGDFVYAKEMIEGTTGVKVRYIRPPYGMYTDGLSEKLEEPLVTWSVDSDDWQDRDAGTIIERVMGAVFDGAVVLLHDIYGTTADGLGELIDRLRAEDYELVTIQEMYEIRGGLPGDGDY